MLNPPTKTSYLSSYLQVGMAKKPEPDGETRNPKFLERGGASLTGFGAGFGALTGIFIGFGAVTGAKHPRPAPPRYNIYTCYKLYILFMCMYATSVNSISTIK